MRPHVWMLALLPFFSAGAAGRSSCAALEPRHQRTRSGLLLEKPPGGTTDTLLFHGLRTLDSAGLTFDSVGIGALPDAAAYGDQGSDTLGNIAERIPLRVPMLPGSWSWNTGSSFRPATPPLSLM